MSLKLRKAAALAALIAVVVPVGNAIAVELPPLDTQSIACREAAGFDALDVFRKPPVPQAISLCEQQAAGHQLLIAPIQPLLENADTLMVSADDTLRYLPFAVLHDGQRYLAERYALSNYSPTTRDIAVAPVRRPTWRVAAFGTTQGQPGLKLSALPGVVGKLRAVVRQDGEQQGALPGQRLLDADFTRESFSRALRRRFPAVHIASHIRLAFNDSQASVMLLGDGQTLPMAAFGGNATTFPLRDIDLLTLSACETAVPVGQDVATGTEVESLSALVHRAGARSVLATLWPVADQATSVFMGRLYTYLADGDGTSKAEALRRTQLDFIQGQTHSGVTGEAGTQRGARRSDTGASSSAPDGWTHPYYWAPFTLLGNWM